MKSSIKSSLNNGDSIRIRNRLRRRQVRFREETESENIVKVYKKKIPKSRFSVAMPPKNDI